MSAPHSTLFLDRDHIDTVNTLPPALATSRHKPAGARGNGGTRLAPSSPTSEPPDALMASPSSSLAMLSMLPTPPASLPTAAAHFVDDAAAAAHHDTAPFAGHELNTEPATPPTVDRRGTTPPFALDDLVDMGDIDAGRDVAVAMELEGALDLDHSAARHDRLDGPFAIAPFGTVAPIHRPFRSRYASSSHDSLDLDAHAADFADEPLDLDLDLGMASHKRSHADVLPSTGQTPPASFDETLARPTSLFSPPESAEEHAVAPRWRRSFSYDAQRAEPTTSVVAATATAAAPLPGIAPSSSLGLLRRRARQPTESDSSLASSHWVAPPGTSAIDRAHSKRRRSGTLGAAGDAFGGGAHSATAGGDVAASRSRAQSRLGSFPLGAGMTSIDAEPALVVHPHGAPSSSTSTPHDPQQAYDALLSHAARSDALAARGEGLLREAAGVLARAEEEVGRAAALVGAREADREHERERQVAERLPSTDGLHDLREVRERPVIGIRLGEGRTPTSPAPAPVSPTSPPLQVNGHRRRSSLWSLSSGFSSPPPQTGDAHSPPLEGTSSSSASSRARSFLTQLRARRPRLSRNSTAVSPPESGPASPPAVSSTSTFGMLSTASPSASSSTAALRTWTLPSPPLVGPFAESAYDESAELAAAERLNRRLLERRRVSESLDLGTALPMATEQAHPAPETSLWGEPSGARINLGGSDVGGTGGIVRRLRGPTQVANERRRFGPSGGDPPFSMIAGPSTATTTATATSSRLSTPSWRRFMRPASVDRREPVTGTQAGDAHYFDRVRDESPSPRRERYGSTTALNAAEEGTSPRRRSLDHHHHHHRQQTADAVRPTIRLPRPESAAERSTSRPRLLFEDDDDEQQRQHAPTAGGWAAPLTLPLMLPSGSDGMLFPHPAAAAGPAVAGGAALGMERQRSASPFGNFGPDHLFHDPPRDELSTGARRTMPWHEHPASAYASRRPLSRFDPWADQPTTNTTATNANAVPLASRISPRRSSLTDTLSSLGARAPPVDVDSADTSLRRRRALPQRAQAGPSIGEDADAHFLERRRALDSFRYADETVVERLAQHRASRMERLQALRRERHAMRTLLGGDGGDGAASPSAEHGVLDAANPWAPPEPVRERAGTPPQARARSPGARGRGLGDFLRGLGGGGTRYAFGGRGGLIGIWDDDLAGFFTRDSAALDPRNYLDDDEFDSSYEALVRLSERLGDVKPKGVSADQLSSLRQFKYLDWPLPTRASSPPTSSSTPAPVASTSAHSLDPPASSSSSSPMLARQGLDKETRCGICLCDYEADDDCMLTVCEHGFHDECLRSWLTQKGTCPVCRRDHVST
ncbi:hypothetical protein JCM8208_000601 [Rhodotorula glutinis]